MYLKISTILALIFNVISLSAQADKQNEDYNYLTASVAEKMAELPIQCLQKEYPNKLNQVLETPEEIAFPSTLHPAFYGCFDWHSAVHGHWLLVRLIRQYPDIKQSAEIRRLLTDNLSSSNIQVELNYFMRNSEKAFERTYGWAWLLKLDAELLLWGDPLAKELHQNLQPLVALIVQRYKEFLPVLLYPVRAGEHPNTAFGLYLAYDYAAISGDETFKSLIVQRAIDYFGKDQGCPLNWEPGGYDFLSPCLQEAALMSKILNRQKFKNWFDRFLPELQNRTFDLVPARVADRTDGKLVHLDGLNFCRAWSLYAVTDAIPQYRHLNKVALQHIDASISSIIDGNYEGDHWLATFAVLSMR